MSKAKSVQRVVGQSRIVSRVNGNFARMPKKSNVSANASGANKKATKPIRK